MSYDRLYEIETTQPVGTSDWLWVDEEHYDMARRYRPKRLLMALEPVGNGRGRIEFTTAKRANIISGNAEIIIWNHGNVNKYKHSVIKNLISAYRIVTIRGTMRAVVRGD